MFLKKVFLKYGKKYFAAVGLIVSEFASGLDGIQNQVPHVLFYVLYVQEVVTLQKKYLFYLHQKMRFTPFINYYDILGWILFVYRAK